MIIITQQPFFLKIPDISKNGHQLSTSASSSGFYSNQSERSDPSPPAPSHFSESAPSGSGMVFGPFQQDEGLDVEETKSDGSSSGSPKQVCSQWFLFVHRDH